MAKARSGGGITSNKLVRPSVKVGPPSTNKVNPERVAQIGAETQFTKPPLITGTMPQVPLGNAVALNVGAGGPGTGRTIYKTGSQSQHGPAIGLTKPTGRDILSQFGPDKSKA